MKYTVQLKGNFMLTRGQRVQHLRMISVALIMSIWVPVGIFLCQIRPACNMCECFGKIPHHNSVCGKCLNSISVSLRCVIYSYVVLYQVTCGSPMLVLTLAAHLYSLMHSMVDTILCMLVELCLHSLSGTGLCIYISDRSLQSLHTIARQYIHNNIHN